ncbi:ankyrin repeat domain-containing protein [Sediminispirochaeta bajacaliforniensis]|uniref:ankyrin repeat domain-containing protein n=1 Tax=Sediminispirochaeta bajacaliforniensis TaxID=148 RepID=UPI00038098E6|nr:ankyrin repeat domain-containing protein [Sediminispirochaeta bajacaliforniensis]
MVELQRGAAVALLLLCFSGWGFSLPENHRPSPLSMEELSQAIVQVHDRYEIPYPPLADITLLYDGARVRAWIEACNEGKALPMPHRWFTGEGTGFSSMIYMSCVSFLTEKGWALAESAFGKRLGNDSVNERNRAILNAFLAIDNQEDMKKAVPRFFPFPTFLKRRGLGDGVSILLPDVAWKLLPSGSTPLARTLVYGDEGFLRGLGYDRKRVGPGYDIRRDPIAMASCIKVRMEKAVNGNDTYLPLRPGMPFAIAKKVAVGDFFADTIWFQPFFSAPDGVETGAEGRLYLKQGDQLFVVSLFSMVDSSHPAADGDLLLGEASSLLSTLQFPAEDTLLDSHRLAVLSELLHVGDVSLLRLELQTIVRETGSIHFPDSHGEPFWHKIFLDFDRDDPRREALLKLFISLGVNPDASGPSGKRAVDYAVEQGDARLLEDVLLARAHGDYLTKDGSTPLIEAASGGDVWCVLTLLRAGVNVDLPDIRGRSALHWAARHDYLAVAKLLLEKGASPENRDIAGKSPLDLSPVFQDMRRSPLFVMVQKFCGSPTWAKVQPEEQ